MISSLGHTRSQQHHFPVSVRQLWLSWKAEYCCCIIWERYHFSNGNVKSNKSTKQDGLYWSNWFLRVDINLWVVMDSSPDCQVVRVTSQCLGDNNEHGSLENASISLISQTNFSHTNDLMKQLLLYANVCSTAQIKLLHTRRQLMAMCQLSLYPSLYVYIWTLQTAWKHKCNVWGNHLPSLVCQ